MWARKRSPQGLRDRSGLGRVGSDRMRRFLYPLVIGLALAVTSVGLARAAEPAGPAAAQAPQPPLDSPKLLHNIELRFPTQGGVPMIEPATYLYYMEIDTHVSQPAQGVFTPYTEAMEEIVLADFRRLWDTRFLSDLWIEVEDDPFENGVEGVRVIFNLEERERVKLVNYTGSDELDRGDIEDMLEGTGLQLRLDTFIDPQTVSRIEAALRQMFAEKGYQFAEVSHDITAVAGGPKLVHVTFHMSEGPKIQIKKIGFVENQVMSDRSLKRKMKGTRERWWLSFISGRGTYQPSKFEEDAELIEAHYRDKGYIFAQVGQPEVTYLEKSLDGKTQGVELRIHVSEGERYRVGNVTFDGNTIVKVEGLESLFNLKPGEFYDEEEVRDGILQAREVYGQFGYYEFSAYPDLQAREEAADGTGTDAAATSARRDADPIVDVTVRIQEGTQYFVNRITFVGNLTTHDEVIRREMRLVENGVFDSEALKYTVRRLNQLGYFEPIDEGAIQVEQAEQENQKNVTFTLTEQNANSVSFGAGISQFDGFFGTVSFQTTNFIGRGETLTVMVQSGSRVKNYMLSFTEPFLFGRPVSTGFSLYRRDIQYIGQFTQSSVGTDVTIGLQVADFTSLYTSYSYQQVELTELNPIFLTGSFLQDPFFQDMLSDRTISKVTPSIRFNTVDHPIFPNEGQSYTLSLGLAGLGGDTKFYNPSAEGIWYFRHTSRTSFGLRGQAEFVAPYAGTTQLPIFERLVLGGEYNVRGYDIRTIGPRDQATGFVIGGNKSLLFNGEYSISIASPVRLIFFYDAGQVRDDGQAFAMNQFRTSTGAEVRFFMPILNVPFRLIFAHNPQREGVLDNRLQLAAKNSFRFAMGTTF